MLTTADNLAYLGGGTRQYGLRPVLGRARGFWELQCIVSGAARPEPSAPSAAGTRAPCLYVSHPDSAHGWTDDGAGFSTMWVVHVRDLPPVLAAQINPAQTLALPLDEREHRALSARHEEARGMAKTGDARLGPKIAQLLVEVTLLALARSAPATPPAPASPAERVERALHWFEENLAESPDVADVARAVGVSAAHLRRLFAEAGRPSPRAELARLRMAAARRCLLEGWKLERVAAFLGFSEASAFSRAFAAECGCSPRAWRSAVREG
ncbi:MAG: AraC family transcriptional regulator [Opitutaceae bacterium]|jgi:AraC-like DNA-binding protein|nr:AraC family transcriptional regulator [Opitutaceae bacterium]